MEGPQTLADYKTQLVKELLQSEIDLQMDTDPVLGIEYGNGSFTTSIPNDLISQLMLSNHAISGRDQAHHPLVYFDFGEFEVEKESQSERIQEKEAEDAEEARRRGEEDMEEDGGERGGGRRKKLVFLPPSESGFSLQKQDLEDLEEDLPNVFQASKLYTSLALSTDFQSLRQRRSQALRYVLHSLIITRARPPPLPLLADFDLKSATDVQRLLDILLKRHIIPSLRIMEEVAVAMEKIGEGLYYGSTPLLLPALELNDDGLLSLLHLATLDPQLPITLIHTAYGKSEDALKALHSIPSVKLDVAEREGFGRNPFRDAFPRLPRDKIAPMVYFLEGGDWGYGGVDASLTSSTYLRLNGHKQMAYGNDETPPHVDQAIRDSSSYSSFVLLTVSPSTPIPSRLSSQYSSLPFRHDWRNKLTETRAGSVSVWECITIYMLETNVGPMKDVVDWTKSWARLEGGGVGFVGMNYTKGGEVHQDESEEFYHVARSGFRLSWESRLQEMLDQGMFILIYPKCQASRPTPNYNTISSQFPQTIHVSLNSSVPLDLPPQARLLVRYSFDYEAPSSDQCFQDTITVPTLPWKKAARVPGALEAVGSAWFSLVLRARVIGREGEGEFILKCGRGMGPRVTREGLGSVGLAELANLLWRRSNGERW